LSNIKRYGPYLGSIAGITFQLKYTSMVGKDFLRKAKAYKKLGKVASSRSPILFGVLRITKEVESCISRAQQDGAQSDIEMLESAERHAT
jgi:hypothetical protein